MKRLVTAILSALLCATGLAKNTESLREEILNGVKSKKAISLSIDGTIRQIRFREADTPEQETYGQIFTLEISKIAWRVNGKRSRELSVADVRKAFAEFDSALRKLNVDAEIELWLSKRSDDQLLRQALEAVVTERTRTIWIRCFESFPRRIDPRFIHKPVAPKKKTTSRR